MSLALDARRLFRAQQHATLGTISTALAGYPYCSVVPYVLDHQARPIILVSRLAEHTHNIDADPRVCLFAHEGTPDVQTGSRATLMGSARRIEGDDEGTQRYMRHFPQARMYREDLDFEFYRIEPASLRVVAGFAKVHWISREAYTPPTGDFSGNEENALSGLNSRCAGAVRDYCVHELEIETTNGTVVGIDCDGFDIAAADRRWRVPFPAVAQRVADAVTLAEQALRAQPR